MNRAAGFLSLTEAASSLGMDCKTVYGLIRLGKLPATKRNGVYMIQQEEIDQLRQRGLEDERLTGTPAARKTTESPRCGLCLRLIEAGVTVNKGCAYEGCEEMLCDSCWRSGGEHLCHKHLSTREQRYETACREHDAGRLPVLVSAYEARQRELNFISRFGHKVRQIIAQVDPVGGTIFNDLYWDVASVWPALASSGVDSLTILPVNAWFACSLQRTSIRIEARVLSRLERYATDGFDTQPLGLKDLLEHLVDAICAVTSSLPVTLYAIGLASTTGWAPEAIDYITSPEPGQPFFHPLVMPCLIDLTSNQVHYNQHDSRLSPFAALFSPKLPEEEIRAVMQAVHDALLRHESMTLSQAAAETGSAPELVKQAFKQLATNVSYVVTNTPEFGLVIMRR